MNANDDLLSGADTILNAISAQIDNAGELQNLSCPHGERTAMR